MTRTAGTFQADTPQPDGIIPLIPGAGIFQVPLASEASALHKIAAGEYSLRTSSATAAYTFVGALSHAIFRKGMQDDLQEAFGSAQAGGSQGLPVSNPITLATASIVAGTSVSITVESTVGLSAGQSVGLDTVASTVQEFTRIVSITDATHIVVASVANSHTAPFPVFANLFTTPASASGRPPFTGSSQLTPVTAARPKGIQINWIAVTYAVNTTAITVPTIGLYSCHYVNGVAPAITTLIAQATNGLLTAAASQPYTIYIPVPLANRSFITTYDTAVTIEFDFTSGASGNVDVLEMTASCAFNYN